MPETSYNIIALREAYRYMLLPTSATAEETAIQDIANQLITENIKAEDLAEFITIKYQIWQETGKLNQSLKKAIISCITISSPAYGKQIGETYFVLHNELMQNPTIDFRRAVILLSHCLFISSMATENRMSATKIAKLLKSVDGRLEFVSWKDVSLILGILKIAPDLTKEDVEELYQEDLKLAAEHFADSTIQDAAYQVGEVARQLRFDADVDEILKSLSSTISQHIPYLQMLHFQCMIGGRYDHIFSSIYEFSPRGAVADHLFNKWNGIVSTSNPFLNNAKAVTSLDNNWAISRKEKEFKSATSLVQLLSGLDTLGFAAAQELAAWIRRWLVHYISLEERTIIPVTEPADGDSKAKILQVLSDKPTETYGVLEQRLVDVIACTKYTESDGWRSRGLGDAVNSNNLSKRKLGDCDFQHSQKFEIIAFEAHGGKLNKLYVEGHLRTLVRSLKARSEELSAIADPSNWKITINFIAFSLESGLPTSLLIEKYLIQLRYFTFNKQLAGINSTSESFLFAFRNYFIEIINQRRTSSSVRAKVAAIIESK